MSKPAPGPFLRAFHHTTLEPGGGFVFQQVHNILANVPPENIVAMFEAAYAHAPYGS